MSRKAFMTTAEAWDSARWPILVLSLKGDEARRSPLIATLERLQLGYHLFWGVDGRTGLPLSEERSIDREVARKKYGRELSDVEFACALSHQRIYRSIIANKWQGAIVLEDDAILYEVGFCDFLQQSCYQHSDLIMLDHSHARVRGPKICFSKNIAVLKLSLPCCLTTGYSVSAKAAQYLIDAGSPLCDVADWPGNILDLEAVACSPKVVTHVDQNFGPSHLRSERTSVKPKPSRFLRASYWRRWYVKRLSRRIS